MGFPEMGVLSWGAYYEGILLFGGLFLGSLIFVNPQNSRLRVEGKEFHAYICLYLRGEQKRSRNWDPLPCPPKPNIR